MWGSSPGREQEKNRGSIESPGAAPGKEARAGNKSIGWAGWTHNAGSIGERERVGVDPGQGQAEIQGKAVDEKTIKNGRISSLEQVGDRSPGKGNDDIQVTEKEEDKLEARGPRVGG